MYWTNWQFEDVGADKVGLDKVVMAEMGIDELALDHIQAKIPKTKYRFKMAAK